MATHSSILVWRIPWTEKPGGLQSMGSQWVRHDWETKQQSKGRCFQPLQKASGPDTQCRSRQTPLPLFQGWSWGSTRQAADPEEGSNIRPLRPLYLHGQLCPALYDCMDCSPQGSSVHGIFQARILEWVAISYSTGSSQPKYQTCVSGVSCIFRWILYHRATWEASVIKVVVVQSLVSSPSWSHGLQASPSLAISWGLLKLMSIESVMPTNHLTICHLLLLLSSIFPRIRVFSSESAFHIRWPKYWSFSFSVSPSNEHSGLISFRMDWLDLLAIQGTLKSFLQHHSSKASILQHSAFFMVQLSHPYMTTGKTIVLTIWNFVGKVMSLLFNMLSRLVIAFFQGASVF